VTRRQGIRGAGPLLALLVLAAAVPGRSRIGASAVSAWHTGKQTHNGMRLLRAVLQPKEFGAFRAGSRGDARGDAWEGVAASAMAAPAFKESPHEAAVQRAQTLGWISCPSSCAERYAALAVRLPPDMAVEALVLNDPEGIRVSAAESAARSAGLSNTRDLSVHGAFLQDGDRKHVSDVEKVLGLATLWGLQWPVAWSTRVTSPFGERVHPVLGTRKQHDGVDLATPTGTELHAPGKATVLHVGEDSVSGRYVTLDHGHGVHSVSCHLSNAVVKRNDAVEVKALYAHTGASGRVTGPHLHYGIRVGGRFVDPVSASTRHQ